MEKGSPITFALLVIGTALTAQGQSPRQSRDSSSAERAARHAQEDFERARRNLAPEDPYPRHSCEVVVGRFCYWSAAEEPDPPPEPKGIGKARAKLLTVLDRASSALSGDPWVVGQRVRYLVEAGQTELAIDAAHTCRAAPWWCDALLGYANQSGSHFAAADSAFTAARANMPPAARCLWDDVSPLLDDDSRGTFLKLPCAQRDTLVTRFWWLAQPLLSQPYNDFWTEHYARLTLGVLVGYSASPYQVRWGWDLEELLIRFGWPNAWTREPQTSVLPQFPAQRMRGHDPKRAVDFTPSDHALADPGSARPEDWSLTSETPRSHYAPTYATVFAKLPYQVARFRRAGGDSMLVVVACPPGVLIDTTTAATYAATHGRVEGALVLGHDPTTPPYIQRLVGSEGDRAMVFSTEAPANDTLLASVELVAPDSRRVARARYALQPPAIDTVAPLTISDVLLFAPSDTLPVDVAAAATRALPDASVPVDKRVGIYFEAYGLDSSANPVGVAITVEGPPQGWLTRVAEALHLSRRSARLAALWRESFPAPTASRSVTLDVHTLRPGDYRLALTLSPADRPPVTTTRTLEIAGP